MLDTLPGAVRAGEAGRVDHPADLIAMLRRQPLPLQGKAQLLGALQAAGFSRHIAAWVSTNLQPLPSAHNGQVGSDILFFLPPLFSHYHFLFSVKRLSTRQQSGRPCAMHMEAVVLHYHCQELAIWISALHGIALLQCPICSPAREPCPGA